MNLLFQDVNRVLQALIILQILCDFFDSVKNRCVVTSSKYLSDNLERNCGHVATQVHRDLTRLNDLFVALLGKDFLRSQIKMIGHNLENQFRGNALHTVR